LKRPTTDELCSHGGIMPNALALVGEYTPKRLRVAVMMIVGNGFTAGAMMGGFISAWLKDSQNERHGPGIPMSHIEDYIGPGAQSGYVASLGERVWGLGLGNLTTARTDCQGQNGFCGSFALILQTVGPVRHHR
jgi:MFS family permease